MAELIYNFIKLKIYIQLYHWNTNNYERHLATGMLYEKLEKNIDRFVEIMQGNRRIVPSGKTIILKNITDKLLMETLQDFVLFFSSKNFSPDLENLREEIIGDIHHTIFLFSLR